MQGKNRKSSHEKRLVGSGIQLFIILFTVIFAFVVVPMSSAWFASNKDVTGKVTDISFDFKNPVELACNATAGENASYHFWEYLSSAVGNNRSVSALYKSKYTGGVYSTTDKNSAPSVTLKTTYRDSYITWWMGENSDFKDQKGSVGYIAPCASGKLTFYVVVNAEIESVDCEIKLQGYYNNSEGPLTVQATSGKTDTVSALSETEDADIISLLNHHILLFANYDGEFYFDRISDGCFRVNLEGVQVGEAVEVSLYWVWAGYYEQFKDCRVAEGSVIAPLCKPKDSLESEDGDYEALLDEIDSHPKYFLSYSDDDVPSDIESLRAAYNLADSKIGAYVSYLQVSVAIK